MPRENFAAALLRHMNRKHWNIQKLAEATDLSRQVISGWLNQNKKPSLESVLKCAKALELTATEQTALLHSAGYSVDATPEDCAPAPVPLPKNASLLPITTRPIPHPRQFFGQGALLTEILTAWSRYPLEHFSLSGGKGSGKTSLLHYLREISRQPPEALRPEQTPPARPYQAVYLDFKSGIAASREEVLQDLLEGLGLPVPESCSLRGFKATLEAHLQQPTVLLLDNIEEALCGYPALDRDFWNFMRALGQHLPQLGFCIASRASAAELIALAAQENKTSPFFNTFKNKSLSPFTPEEAREFLSHAPLIPADDGEWMMRESGGWAVLLQLFCEARLAVDDGDGETWKSACRAHQTRYAHLFGA